MNDKTFTATATCEWGSFGRADAQMEALLQALTRAEVEVKFSYKRIGPDEWDKYHTRVTATVVTG